MAYFRRNETEETLQQPVIRSAEERADRPQEEYVESDYDDGFDDPDELEEDELSKEERNEIHKKRFLMLSGAGNDRGYHPDPDPSGSADEHDRVRTERRGPEFYAVPAEILMNGGVYGSDLSGLCSNSAGTS